MAFSFPARFMYIVVFLFIRQEIALFDFCFHYFFERICHRILFINDILPAAYADLPLFVFNRLTRIEISWVEEGQKIDGTGMLL